jgi:RNA polymerase sigma-70 factor (ECF subfamily)
MTTLNDLGLDIIEHTASLRRYARTLTWNVEEGEDLVQDCLERALSRPHLYQPGTNLRAWLFTMMRNIAITRVRRNKLHRDHVGELMATNTSATLPNQFHHVALKESLQMIAELPPNERQAVVLRGILDMSYEDLAERAGVPVGTVKSRLSRGRAHLRERAESAAVASYALPTALLQ